MNTKLLEELKKKFIDTFSMSIFGDDEYAYKFVFCSIDYNNIFELKLCVDGAEEQKADADLFNNLLRVFYTKLGEEHVEGMFSFGRPSIYYDYLDGFEQLNYFYETFKRYLKSDSRIHKKINLVTDKIVETDEYNLALTGEERITNRIQKKHKISLDIMNFKDSVCLGELYDGIPSVYFFRDEEDFDLIMDDFTDLISILKEIKEECKK